MAKIADSPRPKCFSVKKSVLVALCHFFNTFRQGLYPHVLYGENVSRHVIAEKVKQLRIVS